MTDRQRAMLTLAAVLDSLNLGPSEIRPALFVGEPERRFWRGVIARHGQAVRAREAAQAAAAAEVAA